MQDKVAEPDPSEQSQRGLDWLNFFIADVETAFGPFVAVYLSAHGWRQGEIGSILTINSAVALATQVPAGLLVDWARRKRLIVAVCIGLVAGGALLIGGFPHYLPVMAGEVMHGLTGGAVRTAVAAIALGLVGHRVLHTRIGRNHRYDALGNAATAAAMGVLGNFASPRAPFFAAAALCLPAFGALARIRGREIDYARARSAEGRREPRPARWRELVWNHRLLIFAGCLLLFQFANASMLPLAGERLDRPAPAGLRADHRGAGGGAATGHGGDRRMGSAQGRGVGRKPLLLVGFAMLPVRAVLFAVATGPWFLVGVQVLGGVTAVVIGIMTPLVVADVTRRSGRYNVALGAVSMIAGLGATISTTAIGFMAQSLGFVAGFPRWPRSGCWALFCCGGFCRKPRMRPFGTIERRRMTRPHGSRLALSSASPWLFHTGGGNVSRRLPRVLPRQRCLLSARARGGSRGIHNPASASLGATPAEGAMSIPMTDDLTGRENRPHAEPLYRRLAQPARKVVPDRCRPRCSADPRRLTSR